MREDRKPYYDELTRKERLTLAEKLVRESHQLLVRANEKMEIVNYLENKED